MKRVGFVGWRGMVGSVLMQRMREEKDFDGLEPLFFTTSQVGQAAPDIGKDTPALADAHDIEALKGLDAIVTCQGGDYTKAVYPKLREAGFKGYWIDAASALRMADHAVIVLDPVNRAVIDGALDKGVKDYIGGNCTVSLMLMGLHSLFARGWVEWASSMTYQAASGAGAANMRELVAQMRALGAAPGDALDNPRSHVLDIDRSITDALRGGALPTDAWGGVPLAASLLPWIDRAMDDGSTREEWKGHVEANKILQLDPEVPIDGLCVRVGSLRCHAQALTIKLTKDVPLADIEATIAESNPWARVVENTKEASVSRLTPAVVSGTLEVPVGRLRKLRMGGDYLGAFTVGDQLLWGAAEPVRRALNIILERG